ncbi:MAG: phosphoribosylaminoimidazole carboxylase [Elusimicrobia bacterium]|nr:phosphoribosylaminoimidazole carboxylase [Elusimicrobiota bacterium]
MSEAEEPVDPEVIPPGGTPPKSAPGPKTFFHPMSGVTILAIDWLAFGIELPTQFIAEPFVAAAAFGFTFWIVSKIQESHGDSPRVAGLKALLGAIAAGVPFPVTGTIIGTAIIMLSGLPKKLPRP